MRVQTITTNKKQAQPKFGMGAWVTGNAFSRIAKNHHGAEFARDLPDILEKAKKVDIKFWISIDQPDTLYITVMPLSKTGKNGLLKELYYVIMDISRARTVNTKTSNPLDFSSLTEEAITRFNDNRK